MAKQQQQRPQQQVKRAAPAPAPARRTEKRESMFNTTGNDVLIFGRQNFLYMGIGLLLVLVGLVAMSGGSMPDPNKWEPERIYSPLRITVAPILMVAGFVVVVLGIFKKEKTAASSGNTDQYA
jgi:predicted cobalt transporter CbtA